ncbi:hypothetical protein RB195_011738 [Necator americanus]|uniref:Uncharacterized protein n=1 Tax=Necator americanus TaxID=51031 RepID=A0ABR1D3T2_NECAM
MKQVTVERRIENGKLTCTRQVLFVGDKINEECMGDQEYFDKVVREVNADLRKDMDKDGEEVGLTTISSDERRVTSEEPVMCTGKSDKFAKKSKKWNKV